MADEKGPASLAVMRAMQEEPYTFDFFQAVRRLENLHTDRPRVGTSDKPQDDLVRFRQNVSLSFAPASIHACRESVNGGAVGMSVNFLGLLGANGPMPLSLTEYVYNRQHNQGDETLARFLDLFNHRMISLFYRAWARNHLCASCDRRDDDWFASYIGSLFGMGTEAFHGRDTVPDRAKLYYCGCLCWQGKNAEGLRAILQEDMNACVTIGEFIGRWVELPEHQRCRLGTSREGAELGATSVVGSRFWECQQNFRIRLGPVGFDFYQRLLPGGDALARLAAWVRCYAGDELGWQLQLVLSKQEVPRTCLGKMGRLGWYSWICTSSLDKDGDDLVLQSQVA